MMNRKLGFFSLLIAAAAYGSYGVLVRTLSLQLTAFQQILFRYAFAIVIALAIFLISRKALKAPQASGRNILLFSACVPLSILFYTAAVLNTKIAVATFALYVGSVLFSAVLGRVFFKEAVTIRGVISLVLVIIGVGFFAYPFAGINIGLVAGLASGFFDSAANGLRKSFSGATDRLMIVLVTSLSGAIAAAILILASRQPIAFVSGLSPAIWLAGLVFGIMLFANNYLLLVGFQNFELTPGTIVLSSELLFATIFGAIFLGEMLTKMEIIGGILIGCAVLLPNLKK